MRTNRTARLQPRRSQAGMRHLMAYPYFATILAKKRAGGWSGSAFPAGSAVFFPRAHKQDALGEGATQPVDSKVNDTGEDLDRGGVDSEVMTPVRGRFCLHRVRNARSP
jgi:hypothetical protein